MCLLLLFGGGVGIYTVESLEYCSLFSFMSYSVREREREREKERVFLYIFVDSKKMKLVEIWKQ